MTLSSQAQDKIDELLLQGDVYNKLAKSIAPEIYGHLMLRKFYYCYYVVVSPKKSVMG